eukprot:jgi/Orpsp1_1/1180018/evm.model.c7180000071811.1
MKFFNTKSILLALFSLSQFKFTQAEEAKYQASTIDNGVILHAFCWSFNTIKEKLPEIKKAGYTAIQTSPITKCYNGEPDDNSMKYWYWTYQPISYEIGNYMVGTEDEFKSLCAAAKEYGIKIIVDAVMNHMSGRAEAILPPFNEERNLHGSKSSSLNEGGRNEVTQMDLIGLRDLNTQSKEVQKLALDFLKRALADGASGFRYDAAKHIELPDDREIGGNYWENVLDNGAEFQYGEILQTSVSREKDYSKLMKVTASNYGFTLRDAVTHNDFSIGRIADYNISVTDDRLITWVESHDNYSNDSKESTSLTNEEITLAWALLAARKDTTPLFFTRPRGGGGANPQFPQGTFVGEEGDPLYKSETVAAVNIFRNSMEGEMENLRNIKDNKVIMIERGSKGAVIVNLNKDKTTIESETLLADGSYKDHISGNLFTVTKGKITGQLLPRSATVLYNSNSNETDPFISINGYPTVSDNKFRADYLDITLVAKNLKKATYSIDGKAEVAFKNGDSIRIGKEKTSGATTVLLRGENAEGQAVSAYYTFTKVDPKSDIAIYFQCEKNQWRKCETINAYIYCLDGEGKAFDTLADWPGTEMKKQSPVGEGYTIIDDAIYGALNYYGQFEFLHGAEKPITTSVSVPTPDVSETTTTTTTTTTGVEATTTEASKPGKTTKTKKVVTKYRTKKSKIIKLSPKCYVKPTTLPDEPTTTAVKPTTTVAITETTTTTTTTKPTVEPTPLTDSVVFFELPKGWNGDNLHAYVYVSGDNFSENGQWPGQLMTKYAKGDNVYTITIDKSLNDGFIIFNDGAHQIPGANQPGIVIKNNGLYDELGYFEIYKPTKQDYIYFEKPKDWNGEKLNVYAYYVDGDNVIENGQWPGQPMTKVEGEDNLYLIKMDKQTVKGNIIFNDGTHQIPGSGESGFDLKDLGVYDVNGYKKQIDDQKEQEKDEPVADNKVTLYYYTGWKSAYIHYQAGSGSWTDVPGVEMTAEKEYQKITIDLGKATTLTFVCNDGGSSWDNNSGNNYFIEKPGSYILKDGKLTEGSL